jgi:ATP-dependent helicase/nuclease subunit B
LSAEAVLIELAREAFAGLDWMQARRDIWERRFSVVARKFLDFERARDAGVASRHAELRGRAPFVVAGEKITLVGQADRVDVLTNGKLEILDFKTGGIPGTGEMQALLAPQLPAEALIARAGGFDGIAPAEAAALAYIKLGAGPEAFEETGYRAGEDRDVTVEVDVLERRLQAQVAAFLLSDTQPMTASIFPKTGLRYREAYEHLARAAEWSGEGGGSEE